MKNTLFALCTLICIFLTGCGEVRDTSAPAPVKPAEVTPVERDALAQVEKLKAINETLSSTNGAKEKTIADLRAERDAANARALAAHEVEVLAKAESKDLTIRIGVKEQEARDAKDQAVLGWFAFGLTLATLALVALAYFAKSLEFAKASAFTASAALVCLALRAYYHQLVEAGAVLVGLAGLYVLYCWYNHTLNTKALHALVASGEVTIDHAAAASKGFVRSGAVQTVLERAHSLVQKALLKAHLVRGGSVTLTPPKV